MSVQTQIDRISEGVTNALSALTDKGVTVPSGSGVDNLASLIAAIEAGGGVELPGTISAMAVGTYTPTSRKTSSVAITHGLGVIPNFMVVFSGLGLNTDGNDDSYNYLVASTELVRAWSMGDATYDYDAAGVKLYTVSGISGVSSQTMRSTIDNNNFTSSKAYIPAGSSYSLKAGVAYYWMCGVITK